MPVLAREHDETMSTEVGAGVNMGEDLSHRKDKIDKR
jgi:hypothetical protein